MNRREDMRREVRETSAKDAKEIQLKVVRSFCELRAGFANFAFGCPRFGGCA